MPPFLVGREDLSKFRRVEAELRAVGIQGRFRRSGPSPRESVRVSDGIGAQRPRHSHHQERIFFGRGEGDEHRIPVDHAVGVEEEPHGPADLLRSRDLPRGVLQVAEQCARLGRE